MGKSRRELMEGRWKREGAEKFRNSQGIPPFIGSACNTRHCGVRLFAELAELSRFFSSNLFLLGLGLFINSLPCTMTHSDLLPGTLPIRTRTGLGIEPRQAAISISISPAQIATSR